VAIGSSASSTVSRPDIVSVTGSGLPTGDEKVAFEATGSSGRSSPSVRSSADSLPIPGHRAAVGETAKEAFWRTTKDVGQRTFGRAWSPMIEVIGFKELEEAEGQLGLVPDCRSP
jgi:hypothetical protein